MDKNNLVIETTEEDFDKSWKVVQEAKRELAACGGIINLEKEGEETNWDDVVQMLDDIRKHPYAVEQNDNPKELIIGYKCTATDKSWDIKITKLRRHPFLAKFFESEEKKNLILEQLNDGK